MKRPSPSLAVSLAALVVALGGTGYAVSQLPKNSVGTAQIKKDAVTGAKVKSGSLDASDFKAGVLLAGTAGPAGPVGVPGAQGTTGARGPSDGYFATAASTTIVDAPATVVVGTLSLPPGKYVATATANVSSTVTGVGGGNASVEVDCSFPFGVSSAVQSARALRQGPYMYLNEQTAVQPLTITAAVDLSAAPGDTALTMRCSRDSNGIAAANTDGVTISAIKVETLH